MRQTCQISLIVSSLLTGLIGCGPKAVRGDLRTGNQPNGNAPGQSEGFKQQQQGQQQQDQKGSAQSAAGNPFGGGQAMFAIPAYQAAVQSSIDANPTFAGKMRQVQNAATAFWLDSRAKVDALAPVLDAARQHSKTQGGTTVTIVVYDLPERDCNANASNGELSLDRDGANEYRKYIDHIASVLASYHDLKIAAIIEPDSLANIATNLGNAKCAKAQSGYEDGVTYAVQHLSLSNVSLYLDTGHSGWLGWPNNRQAMVQIVKRILDRAGGVDKIRGFATNVANYSPLSLPAGASPAWYDPSNPAKDELTFVSLMAQDFANGGVTSHHFVIDTSRNGNLNSRAHWGSWCNVANAGIGKLPSADPAAGVDAYLWVKPPGESDGTSDGSAKRYDYACSSDDSAKGAPEAGEWFNEEFVRLVNNAAF